MHRRTKFRKGQSNRCGDIAIFVIFKMAAAAIFVFHDLPISILGLIAMQSNRCGLLCVVNAAEWSFCLLVTSGNTAKADKPIDMKFGE